MSLFEELRFHHGDYIFLLMEDVMPCVIEESKGITFEFLSDILDVVRDIARWVVIIFYLQHSLMQKLIGKLTYIINHYKKS